MPELVDDLIHLPIGSHCVSFHVSSNEAADHAVDFLAGAPRGMPASYWVPDSSLVAYYDEKLRDADPEHVGCVHALAGEQVHEVDGHLRPVEEVKDFIREHPGGVTAAGETLSMYWTRETIPDHLEYEKWFEEQPRDDSRFLCPYDLRRVPPEMAPKVLRELGAHHSHALLSSSNEPAVRLLQLFVFARPEDLPTQLVATFSWANSGGLVRIDAKTGEMVLTPEGEQVVAAWGRSTRIDWSPPTSPPSEVTDRWPPSAVGHEHRLPFG